MNPPKGRTRSQTGERRGAERKDEWLQEAGSPDRCKGQTQCWGLSREGHPHPHRQQWGSRAAASLEVRLGVLGLEGVLTEPPGDTTTRRAKLKVTTERNGPVLIRLVASPRERPKRTVWRVEPQRMAPKSPETKGTEPESQTGHQQMPARPQREWKPSCRPGYKQKLSKWQKQHSDQAARHNPRKKHDLPSGPLPPARGPETRIQPGARAM